MPTIPQPIPVVFHFKAHTMTILWDNEPIEYMMYAENGDRVLIYKRWGVSPCDPLKD